MGGLNAAPQLGTSARAILREAATGTWARYQRIMNSDKRGDPDAKRYIDSVRDDRRAYLERLQALIFGLYPDANLVRSYGIAAYKIRSRWIGLGYRKDGVTLYTKGQRIPEFEAKYPGIQTSKGGIQFKLTDKVSDAALRKLIRRVVEGQKRS